MTKHLLIYDYINQDLIENNEITVFTFSSSIRLLSQFYILNKESVIKTILKFEI